MNLSLVTLICFSFLTAGIAKGSVGMGQMTVALAILSNAIGLRELVPLMVIPALITNIVQVYQSGNILGIVRRFWIMNATGWIGIWLGTKILFMVEPAVLTMVLGAVLCTYSIMGLTRAVASLPQSYEPVISPPIGLVSGTLTGATGTLHLLIIAYFQVLGLEKDKFIQANAFTGLVSTIFWIGALVSQKVMGLDTILLSTFALVPTLIGLSIGTWLRHRVSQPTFRKCIFCCLLLIGLNLIKKSFL